MPSNRRSVYRCSDCGTDYPKWTGRCESCGASDLGVAAALVSSASDVPCPHDTVFVGEVGLGGEVRPVPGTEAERLGFRRAFVSARATYQTPIQTISIRHVTELHDRIAA